MLGPYGAPNLGRLQVQKRQKEILLCKRICRKESPCTRKKNKKMKQTQKTTGKGKKKSIRRDFVANAGISAAADPRGQVTGAGGGILLLFPSLPRPGAGVHTARSYRIRSYGSYMVPLPSCSLQVCTGGARLRSVGGRACACMRASPRRWVHFPLLHADTASLLFAE